MVENKKASKNPQNIDNFFLKVALQLVHSNCFYQKIILDFLNIILYRAQNIKKIKTDELGINAPLS
jgi:hypothetical protein